jgi:hypothetical protein
VTFRPNAVQDITQSRHVELLVPRAGKIIVRQL